VECAECQAESGVSCHFEGGTTEKSQYKINFYEHYKLYELSIPIASVFCCAQLSTN